MDNYDNEEASFWYIFTYIKDHFIQILMFLGVFIIIYAVDYISNINSAIFSMPSPILGLNQRQLLSIPSKKRKVSKK